MITLAIHQDGGQRCLTVGGEAVLEHAGELKTKLLELLRGSRQMEIRLDHLERIDLSALQLLCAAHRQASAQKKTLRLCPQADGEFQACCRRSGFSRSQGCRFDADGSCIWVGRNQRPA